MWLIWIIIIPCVGINLGWICALTVWQFPEKRNFFSSPICTQCKERLIPVYQIPILGFILTQCKCSHCKKSLPSYLLIIPVLSPILLILFFIKFELSVLFFQFGFLAIIAILIFFLDLYYRVIPDIITFPMMACGILFSFFNGLGFWFSLKGFALGAGVFILIALLFKLITKRDGLGGGDIKLIAMIGLFLGFQLTFLTIFLSSILGILIYAFSVKRNKILIPYGSFIIMAMFVSILIGNDIIRLYLQIWGL
ncbi:MAG: prepilin peptidase [Candidatus Cloacimonetes bacterium]|nr:prepilin peptidase [Candidatus Cloacimonadota bacterium]